MSPVVRLVIAERHLAKTVRLPDIPERGELIQLGDGTRLVVTDAKPTLSDQYAAEVRARLLHRR